MQKILIIQGARFGDVLQTKRLAASLACQGEVHLAIDGSLLELARLTYPQAVIHGLKFHGQLSDADLGRNMDIFGELRKVDYSKVFCCNFSPLAGAVGRLFPRERLVGYWPARNSDGGLLRSPWNRISFRLGAKRKLACVNLVDLWGWLAENPIAPAAVNPEARHGGGGIGVAVSGRMERRSMSLPLMALSIDIAAKVFGAKRIKLFGTVGEDARARKLMRLLPPRALSLIHNLCGKTDWQSLADEMDGLDLLITPDTGLMHMAAQLGVPVLAFFLSSAFCHETGPYGTGHIVLQAVPECAPCLESAPCPNQLKCAGIFENRHLGRILSEILSAKSISAMPDGLQVWKTAFDDAGLRLALLAGHDGDADARHKARMLVREYLGLADACEAKIDMNADYIDWLFPDSEWMLPPWRYC